MQEVKRFSSSRERIFQDDFQSNRIARDASTPEDEGDWVDLYELLEVPREMPARDLDEIIIDRGADVVLFSFARGKPPHIARLEKHLHAMRPILLDAPVRRRYDAQLQLHQEKNPRAMPYNDFLKTLDLREQAGSCLSTLIFFLASPLAFLLLGKFIGRI